jgi:hypothetical protein
MRLCPQQPVGRSAFSRIAVFSFIILVSFIILIGLIITVSFVKIARCKVYSGSTANPRLLVDSSAQAKVSTTPAHPPRQFWLPAHQTWSSPWFDRWRIPGAAVVGVGCYLGNFMVASMAINQEFDAS